MTELVDLIVADELVCHLLLDILDIGLGGSDGRNSGAREGNLRGGTELIYHIRVSSLFTLGKDLQNVARMIRIQVMYAVCVIPVNTEILCSRL